jgi:hypothetical protein
LELIANGFKSITMFEQSPSLLVSTSSMISATINLDTNYRKWMHGETVMDPYEIVTNGFSATASHDTRWAEFVANVGIKYASDSRTGKPQKRKVFRASYDRMLNLVRRFPSLCGALIGAWCCDAGPEARTHLQNVGHVACAASSDPTASTVGLFQLTTDPQMCAWMARGAQTIVPGCDDEAITTQAACEAAGHGWVDVAYTFYDANQTRARVGDFLRFGPSEPCSIVEHRMSGFARSEVLFGILGELLRAGGVNVALNCNVASLRPVGDVSGTVQVVIDPASTACQASNLPPFQQVIVAAGAASVALVSPVDPSIKDNLVGVMGYGLAGSADAPQISGGQSGRGLHFMDESKRFAAAYVRTTTDMRVKAWGGNDVHAKSSDLKPPYAFCDAATVDHIFREGPACAKAIVDLPGTVHVAGMRPVPSIGGVPLIKRYTAFWQNVFLNTGYGYNGYDLTWFASACTAQWVVHGQLTDPICIAASKSGPE